MMPTPLRRSLVSSLRTASTSSIPRLAVPTSQIHHRLLHASTSRPVLLSHSFTSRSSQPLKFGPPQRSSFHTSTIRSSPEPEPAAAASALSASSSADPSYSGGWYDFILPYFEPVVPYVHSLPDIFHLQGPHKYVISIVLATIALRTVITLPVHVLQRIRTRRYAEIVKPEFDRLRGKDGVPKALLPIARRAGKTHEEYKKMVEQELRSRFRALVKEHKCHPVLNVAMPVLITIPVVFFISLSLRAGTLPPSPLWDEFIPWWSPPADLEASFKASAQILAERGMDAETLSHLTKPIGPSLGQVDTTFVGPLALLGLNWANFELSGWVRKTNLSNEQPSEVEKGIAQQQKQRTGVDSEDQIKDAQSMRSRIVSRVVRMWTIALVPVAANVPSAIIIYWLASATYTLAQLICFTVFDKLRLKHKAAGGPLTKSEEVQAKARQEKAAESAKTITVHLSNGSPPPPKRRRS